MPYDEGEEKARHRLKDQLRAIEGVVDERDKLLVRYVQETFHGVASGLSLEESAEVRHLATLQVRVMEEAYETLRLHRYANAPANRGWMNLFRRWGGSPTFVVHVESMKPLLGEAFGRFFDHYVRGRGQIESDPVPHPWDEHATRGRERAARIGTQRPEGDTPPPAAPGVYLDSGIIETVARSDRAEHPSTQNVPKRDEASATPREADSAQDQGPARGEPNA